MRSSAVLIFAAFAAHAVAQEYNYTFPSGFDLANVSTSDLSEQNDKHRIVLIADML
jgi:hypothetical protein